MIRRSAQAPEPGGQRCRFSLARPAARGINLLLAGDRTGLRLADSVGPDPAGGSAAGRESEAMDLVLQRGVIRSGALDMTLTLPDTQPRRIELRFLDGASGWTHAVSWPDDFERESGRDGDALSGRLRIPDADALPLFSGVSAAADGLRPCPGPDWHLNGLYAFSEEQFERHFNRHKHRIRDKETLIFATLQLLRHYELDEAHRCIATVIYAYRAVDSGDLTILEDASQWILRQYARVERLHLTGNARSDRDHLSISLLTVLWHLHLASKQFDDVERVLDQAIEISRAMSSPMATIPYNLSRMIFLRGWLLFKEDKIDQAIEVLNYNFDFYVLGFKNIERNVTRFVELEQAHHIVGLSLQCIDRIKTKKKNFDTPTVLDTVSRVRSDEGLALLQKNFIEMVRAIRQRSSS